MTHSKSIFRSLFISTIIVVIMACLVCAVFADEVAECVIYVSPDGDDDIGDGTKEAPYFTLKRAFKDIVYTDDSTIVVMGDIEPDNAKAWNSAYGSIKGHEGTLTITGKDPYTGEIYKDAILRYDSPILEGDTVIEYIMLAPPRNWAFIETSGYNFVFGEGVTHGQYGIYAHDGATPAGRKVVYGTNTLLKSGDISSIYIGGGYPNSTDVGVEGNVALTVDGATVESITIGFDKYKDTHTPGFINGDVIITLNNGQIGSISSRQLLDNRVRGAIYVMANNGTSAPSVATIDTDDGVYVISSTTHGTVVPTDEPGVFKITAKKKYSCYVDNKLFEGDTIKLEPGQHKVVFKRIPSTEFFDAYASGFEDGTFRPDEKLTRAQAIKLVTNACGLVIETEDFETSFTDISKSDWYYKTVVFMEENEILPPEWKERFMPNEEITRGEYIYITDAITFKSYHSIKLKSFSDVTKDSTPYYTAIISAANADCINGYGDGTFRPEETLTRAEAVTVINRYLSRTPVSGVDSGFSDVYGHWASGEIAAATSSVNDGKWTYSDTNDAGQPYILPTGHDVSAEDYITSLHTQSKQLSGQAIRDGVEVIADKMREDVLSSSNTTRLYASRITRNKYYISENGDDVNGKGTASAPYKTFSGLKANKTLRAGDAVLFERGGVYRGSISVTKGVVYGAYGTGNKPLILQSKKNYADPDLWQETEWENVWVCTDLLKNVGVIGFDHDMQDYSENTYNELYGITMNKDLFGFDGPHELCGDLQFYSELNGSTSALGKLYVYSKDGNPGERFDSIEIGENVAIVTGAADDVVIDNLSFKFTGGHGMGGAGGCKNRTVTNCIYSWLGGSVLSLNFHGNGSPVNYGNAVEIYGACSGYYVKNNWMYQIYDTAVTHQRSSSLGDCIQEDVLYSENLMEYVYWGIEFYNSPPTADQLNGAEDTYTRITRNVVSEYNLLRLGGYGWGSIVRYRGCALYCGSALSENYDCYSRYNIFDRAYGKLLNLPKNSNENTNYNIYIQHIGQTLGNLKGTTTICDMNALEHLANRWGDENAVVVVIDPNLDPIVRNIPEGLAESGALY